MTLVPAYDLSRSEQARTDSTGTFVLRTGQPGEYVLWVSKAGAVTSAAAFDLKSGGQETVTLTLTSKRP